MSFSGGNSARFSVSVSAILGMASYAAPLIAPWHVLIPVTLAIIGHLGLRLTNERALWSALSIVVVFLTLSGSLPSSIAGAMLASLILVRNGAYTLAGASIALHLSTIALLQCWVTSLLAAGGVESAAPSLIAIGMILLASGRNWAWGGIASLTAVLGAWLANTATTSPSSAMAISCIPALGIAWLAASGYTHPPRNSCRVAISALHLLSLISWLFTWPTLAGTTYVVLPHADSEFEATYFKNYVAALRFVGIQAEAVTEPALIPQSSTVLLPWLTAPLTDEVGRDLESELGALARERNWTVLLGGEHTNLGGVADRIRKLSGVSLLSEDLTVPSGNSDTSGPLHVAGLQEWRKESILNRGASVLIPHSFSRILLAADGWWIEPNIGEWLWVGDYILEPSDKEGRIALAAAVDVDGARWVVLGDNTPFLNTQLLADPRPLWQLLQLATLWPTLCKDLLLVCLFYGFLLEGVCISRISFRPSLALVGLITIISLVRSFEPESKWAAFFVGQSAFDSRNFNDKLANSSALLEGPMILRESKKLKGSFPLPGGDAILFAHVDDAVGIGSTQLSQCRRLGSLKTDDGPYLMDAQACSVDGPATTLVGSRRAAAAFWTYSENSRTLVVLDTAFLARRAPQSNAEWLVDQFRSSSTAKN